GGRSGRGLGRSKAAARALSHRAVPGHRSRDRQPGGCRDHHHPDGSAGLQRHQQRRRPRRPRDRGARASRGGGTVSGGIPAVVLGGSGYVAGELLRLIAAHPRFELAAVMSESAPGEPVAGAFPHLAGAYPDLRFSSQREALERLAGAGESAVFSAAPHGVSAALVDTLLSGAARSGRRPRVVDVSADFRYATPAAYAAVYQHPHAAPARLAEFTCAVPEHLSELTTPHVGHPGCFATAILLACVPLLARGLVTPTLFVSGVTGSTGSGRRPVEATHHPLRHADLYSYLALEHRHAPEVTACAHAVSGVEAYVAFVPHSGPFARGIHVTVQAELARPLDTGELLAALSAFYARSPFVRVSEQPPRVKDVVASNYAHLSGVVAGRTAAVLCDRQPDEGRGRRRAAVDEPPVRPARDHRAHERSARLDLSARACPRHRHRRESGSRRPPSRRSRRPSARTTFSHRCSRSTRLKSPPRRACGSRAAAASACSISTADTRSRASATGTRRGPRHSHGRPRPVSSRATRSRCESGRKPHGAWCASRDCRSRAHSSSTAAPRPTRTRSRWR